MADEISEKQQSDQMLASNKEVNFFGLTNFRNQNRKFGIKLDDRRRHMYVVGKTGMGKTTLLENMVLNDIYAGHGIGIVDPHGDFAEKIINYIPANRINDVVYFNPSDVDYPIGFNILETIRPEQKHLITSGLMGVFKKIWPDVWSARMEYILNNTILALLDFPNTTLLGINRMLADATYRRRVVKNIKDPVVKTFWEKEFANYNDRYQQEAVAPVQNKIGQFLSASIIRNIVSQVKSRINIREIMDTKKIFIMNLSKGRIGEDNSRLLGGMLVTKIQLSAMERVDIPETERSDFFLYVDEFQNFATESFANILSEARKYRLALIMAHQYMEQLDEKVLAAIIGNVGTTISYRVGSTDAEILAKEFAPIFIENDLVNLPKYQVFLKLMIDGISSQPFSAMSMPPIGSPTGSAEKVIRVSRERYATSRDKIEEKIMRWSGMDVGEAGMDEEAEDEEFAEAAPKKDAGANISQEEKKIETKKPEFKKDDRPRPKQFEKPRRDSGGWDKNKPKEKFDIKASAPVLSVDPTQKGISLAALQAGNQPKPKKDRVPQQSPASPAPIQAQNEAKPAESLSASVLGLSEDEEQPQQTEEKKIYPDRVVKLDS